MTRVFRRAGWRIIVCAVALVALRFAPAGLAHPQHVTLAEMEFNQESRCFEVSLRVTPEDMERILSRRSGTLVNLERTENVDERIAEYLAETFVCTRAGSDSLDLVWVGKEVSHRALWLYFEVPWTGQGEGIVVRNSMFFDFQPKQANTVILKDGENRRTWNFMPGDPAPVGQFGFP